MVVWIRFYRSARMTGMRAARWRISSAIGLADTSLFSTSACPLCRSYVVTAALATRFILFIPFHYAFTL
jgi:hypothetical protein